MVILSLHGFAEAASVKSSSSSLENGKQPLVVSSSKPNIVFLIADDERWDMLSCSGNKYLKTPNRDRLASEGMRFENAFTTSAVCSPSRGSFLTGKHVHQCGTQPIIHMNYTFHRSERPFPAQLHDVGYYTAHFGKWHLGEGDKKKPGYDHWVGYYALTSFFDPLLTTNDGQPERYKGFSDFVIADLASDHIREIAQNDQPFCVYVAFGAPHYDFSYPEHLEHVLDDVEIDHPPSFYEDVAKSGKPKCIQHSPLRFSALHKSGAHVDPKSDTLEKMMRRYMRSSLSLDESCGKIMQAIEDAGVAENTIFVYTSDHGHMLGEHGLAAKHLAYEESTHVPLIVRYPRMINPGSVRDDIVANIDIAPTLLDLAGAPIPDDVAGHSMRPLFEAGNKPVLNWVDDYAFLHETCVAVRTHTHKIIHYPNNEWELYDLESDPYEITNLYGNAAYAEVQQDMAQRLANYIRETDFPTALQHHITSPWLLGPFAAEDADAVIASALAGKTVRADGKAYSWKQPSDPTQPINPTVVLGGNPDEMFLTAFDIEVLADRDPFVRLWFTPLQKALTGWVNGEQLYNRHTNGSFWDHTFNPPLVPGRNRLLFLGKLGDYPTLSIRVHGHEGKTRIVE